MLKEMLEIIKRLSPANFNDALCIFILGCIFTLWLLGGLGVLEIDREVLGATIAFFATIGHFYYRKARGEDKKQ